MNLFIDARMWSESGIGRHIRGISSAIYQKEINLTLLAKSKDQSEIRKALPDSKLLTSNAEIHSFDEQVSTFKYFLKHHGRGTLSWFPHFSSAVTSRSPFIVTIHDTIQLNLPKTGKYRLLVPAARIAMLQVLKRSSAIVAVSKYAKDSLLAEFSTHFLDRKIQVIYNGVDNFWSSPAEEAPSPIVNSLKPFLLMVGNKKPHKNHLFIVKLLREILDQFPTMKLIIVGKREPEWLVQLQCACREHGIPEDSIRDLDPVSDQALKTLYLNSELFLMPSLDEGFGIPPLEAMSCGVPVISSNRGALPEILEGAALTLDPLDAYLWKQTILKILHDRETYQRLRSLGLQKALEFSWEQAGEQFFELIKRHHIKTDNRR